MKYRIEKLETGIGIRIYDVAGQEQAVLATIRQCRRQGIWACPSGECQNIGSMEERAEGGSVFLTLTPTPGATIDPSGIDECLRYVLHQAIKV